MHIDAENKEDRSDDLQGTAEEIAELTSEESAQGATADMGEAVRNLEAERDRLLSEIQESKKALEEERNGRLRALADFANYKRRQEEDRQARMQAATRDLIVRTLPVIDNFERALQAAQENRNFEGLTEGVLLTLKQLYALLEQEGVTPIEAVGQEFDPTYHEAVMRVETEEVPENTVVDEIQKGYTQGAQVIRPSRVTVAVR